MEIGNGGAAMGFSQEVVREFQVCMANCDLSSGMTASGSVNVATRSGGAEWHGSGFYFFRDHYLSAYPGLTRDPSSPDPFFQRQQFGASAGGPVRAKSLFLFTTVERNEQTGVVSTKLLTPEFAPLSRITPTPSYGDELSVRLDWLVNEKNSAFLRHSHEGGFSAVLTGIDMNGDGTTGDLLPGTVVNRFNRSMVKLDLQHSVQSFNQTYAGKLDARGTLLPLIALPGHYEFGDPLVTQDLRMSRNFAVRERLKIALIGELFNVLNISNLSDYSNNLIGAGFGQPKSRVTQVFGSGGPRAFQFGTRVAF